MTQPEVKHPLFIGIDVGGTNVKFGIVDDKGGIQAYGSISPPIEDQTLNEGNTFTDDSFGNDS